MLISLLRTFLVRYKRPLLAVVILQSVQTAAALFLPALNAKIIDNGILTGDTEYILKVGGLMLLLTCVQVAFAIGAIYYASSAAMGFPRRSTADRLGSRHRCCTSAKSSMSLSVMSTRSSE